MTNPNPNPALNNNVPTLDQLNGAILSDYVYHLVDSASQVPAGWVPLTTGASKTALKQYDAASGDYAEVYAKTQTNANGSVMVDAYGNPVPAEIMVVYRGTVFTDEASAFQTNAAGQALAATAASDSKATLSSDVQIVLGQEGQGTTGSTVSAVESFDANIKSAISNEFGAGIKSVPFINDGQSLGGMNAIFATASALAANQNAGDGWNVSALTFNSPPVGVILSNSNIYLINPQY